MVRRIDAAGTGSYVLSCMERESLFEKLGYRLGKAAAKARSVFDLVGGDEVDALVAEVRLGRDLEAAVLERVEMESDNDNTRWLGEIGCQLVAQLRDKHVPFRFHVTAEQSLNAFAVPGGAVFVSRPLLDLCGGQRDEVGFVLAHEMAHIVLRHAIARVVEDSLFSLVLRSSPARGAASAWLERVGRQVFSRAFSRDDELEADSFALKLVRSSGGDGAAGENLMEKLARQTPDQGAATLGEYLSTHPPFAERIANLRE